jgi:hypothetical protein
MVGYLWTISLFLPMCVPQLQNKRVSVF